MKHPCLSRLTLLSLALLMSACTSVPQQAQQMAQAGQIDGALQLLTDAMKNNPNDTELRMALQRQQEAAISIWANQAEQALRAGQNEMALALLIQAQKFGPTHPRVKSLQTDLDRLTRHELWLQEANTAYAAGRLDEAENKVNKVLSEARNNAAARLLKFKLGEQVNTNAPPRLGPAFQKPVSLEFREAPLRQVMEALARSTGVNFVFDPEVRGDLQVSIQLKQAGIDDALKVILATHQLEQKALNESTILIYPASKKREHQDFATRSFYLVTADVKQALLLVKNIAKVKDTHLDERLNLLIVRDTPEVLKLVERLIAAIDIAEPEVMLEVEVVEISTSLKEQLGLQWPSSIVYGNATNSGMIDMANRGPMSFKISNPALTAAFNETSGKGNTLANPRLRVKNKEKAKIVIGEKLPVFSTTLVANVGSSSSVSYLDVGLKLDIEPVVSLDNEVTLKVALEVSSVTNAVTSGTNTAYQIGSRQASSVIRLRDGETQVFAGLIKDDDITAVQGLPGLARMPLLGRLFGQHTDTKNKTELALFITPRVIRNLELPDASVNFGAGGTETNPGTLPLRLNPASSASVPLRSNRSNNPQNSFQIPFPVTSGTNPTGLPPEVLSPQSLPPVRR